MQSRLRITCRVPVVSVIQSLLLVKIVQTSVNTMMTPSCEGLSVMNIHQLFTMPGTVLRVFSYIIFFIPHVHSVREVNEPPLCKQGYEV